MMGVLPKNKTDFVTMLHDIDYLRNAGLKHGADLADDLAINNADYSMAGLATKIGLGVRKGLGLKFNQAMNGYTEEQTRKLGVLLMNYVMVTNPYQRLFQIYGIKRSDYY